MEHVGGGIESGWDGGRVDGWMDGCVGDGKDVFGMGRLRTYTHTFTNAYIFLSQSHPFISYTSSFFCPSPPGSTCLRDLRLLNILLENLPNLLRALLRVALLPSLVVDICDAETRAVALVPLVVAAGTVVSGRALGRKGGREVCVMGGEGMEGCDW